MMKIYTHKTPENRTKQKILKLIFRRNSRSEFILVQDMKNWLKVENILKCAFGIGNQK